MNAGRNVHSMCRGGSCIRPRFRAYTRYAPTLYLILCSSLSWARSSASIRAFNEGVKYFNTKQFNEAIPRFDEAISGDAEFADAYFARGACRYYLKSMDGALLDLNEALRLKPDYGEARSLRGAVNYESDHWDDALEDFNAVLEKNSRDAQSLLGRAVIFLKRDKLDAAAQDFKGFLRVRPDDPLAPKVRQLLTSLRRPPSEHMTSVSRPSASPREALSAADLQRLADSLLNHPLAESYGRKVLRGEKVEAVGDIHSVPGVPADQKNPQTGVEIVEPQ